MSRHTGAFVLLTFNFNTAEKADRWEQLHPGIIKAVHQQNGGHGQAVNTGLANATGLYFKVVDSDDWLDRRAMEDVMAYVRSQVGRSAPTDLVIANYVYEKVHESTRTIMHYRNVFPEGREFGWSEVGHFNPSQYLLMHSVIYRTELLRGMGLQLPKHTFYVDNIYAYVPFPLCHSLYYLDVDLYRYYIGREDQSVNEKVLTGRVDHYWRVARVMMKAYHVYDDIDCAQLRSYMMNYFTIIMAICSVFSKLSDRPDAMDELKALWDELKAYDSRMYRRAKHGVVGIATNLPGKVGEKITIGGYRVAQKVVKFN